MLQRIGQAAFMQWDSGMPGAVAKSIGVNDELGRVQFLFSDKTGTLTANEVLSSAFFLSPPLLDCCGFQAKLFFCP